VREIPATPDLASPVQSDGVMPMNGSAQRPEKVVVVMPAYNAGRTLRMTYEELPKESVSLVILVDDGSTDGTLEVARQLGLEIFVHNRNYGYGANQKTCYAEALRAGADIVVMVHPDYQYDPRLVPQIIAPIVRGEADVVLGSRLKSGSALAQGMPWWKYISNRFLTRLENQAFGLSLSEFHTGYRAFRRGVLETVNLALNSDGFVFDQEIIAQVVSAGFRIEEISVPTRYFEEASSASFAASTVYGLRILSLLARYKLHCHGMWHSRAFDSLRGRYTRLAPASVSPRTAIEPRRSPALGR
jgi:glycosyltransferase involved in cell wall biosynthesis